MLCFYQNCFYFARISFINSCRDRFSNACHVSNGFGINVGNTKCSARIDIHIDRVFSSGMVMENIRIREKVNSISEGCCLVFPVVTMDHRQETEFRFCGATRVDHESNLEGCSGSVMYCHCKTSFIGSNISTMKSEYDQQILI